MKDKFLPRFIYCLLLVVVVICLFLGFTDTIHRYASWDAPAYEYDIVYKKVYFIVAAVSFLISLIIVVNTEKKS